MKTPCFLFAMVGFGALTLGLSLAAEPSDAPRRPAPSQNRGQASGDRSADQGQREQPRAGGERAYGTPSDHKPDGGPASGKSALTKGTKTTDKRHPGSKQPQPLQSKGEHPGEKQADHVRTTTAFLNPAAPYQPALIPTTGTSKTASTINTMEDHRGLRVAGVSSHPTPSQVVPHRGPGPAIIGGLAASSTRSTAVINGTVMRHRP
jgi:hypothetical protein